MTLKINYRLQNGNYVIKKILKQDIFGITYLVYDVKMEKDVILKEFLPPHLARRSSNGRELLSLNGKERNFLEDKKVLRKKIKTLSKLKHTSLLKIYNIFEENNTIYYVTEYVNGTILWNHIENNPMSQADILEMVSYIASAVETIHEKKLLHGNLTPCNIILTSENKPIIIDFIFLRYGFHEYENSSYEKFDYACFLPSEQFSHNSSKDSYTDIYTLASTIYMMATGKAPLSLRDRSEGEKLVDIGDLYTDNFKDAIYQAMELSVRDRTQTINEFTKALFTDKKNQMERIIKWVHILFKIILGLIFVFLFMVLVASINSDETVNINGLKRDKISDKNYSKSVEPEPLVVQEVAKPVIPNDVVVIDGLWYQKQPFTKEYKWEDAKNYCDHLSLAGYDDWRLPQKEELKKLLILETNKNSKGYEHFIRKEFSENMPEYGWFWSITENNNDSSFAWSVGFHDGLDNWYFKSYENYALCVRGQ